MDKDGFLSSGVWQGGRRKNPGIYGRQCLPAVSSKRYVRTDILSTRPGETRESSGRLVFSGRGEIWYARHYDDGFAQIEGRAVVVRESGSASLWVDLEASLPWLGSRPYLVDTADGGRLIEALPGFGFHVFVAEVPDRHTNIERALLVELSRVLGFSELGAGSWAAYSGRLWDLQRSEDRGPIAIVINGLDDALTGDLHAFVRCVHFLLSMTEGVGLEHESADRQIEYFFVGNWAPTKS